MEIFARNKCTQASQGQSPFYCIYINKIRVLSTYTYTLLRIVKLLHIFTFCTLEKPKKPYSIFLATMPSIFTVINIISCSSLFSHILSCDEYKRTLITHNITEPSRQQINISDDLKSPIGVQITRT